jgi:integrase/recombinase XerD
MTVANSLFLLPTISGDAPTASLQNQILQACRSWLLKSPSPDTRSNYERDVRQFLAFAGIAPERLDALGSIRPEQVSAWRDALQSQGLTNSSIRRKMTALRSLFSYLQSYGFTGKNPAHSDFVAAPSAPRDGKTVALSPADCRRLLDAPLANSADAAPPASVRDQAILAVLAFTGCRVGELTRLKVGSYKQNGVHRILEIHGKGGKERQVPLHPEAAEKLEHWIAVAGGRSQPAEPLFRPVKSARGKGADGFAAKPITRRAVQKLVESYVRKLKLDPNVTVHSLRVTALTTARERGSDIIDLQDFAGHSDPRTTLTYIRTRNRLHESPAYVLKY